ncbi:MAG: ATP-binding cassette domain-containing protein [Oligoflexia bacterium]
MSLELKRFRKAFSNFELRAHFSVEDRERLVLRGPSGCGKTTLFRFIAGLDHSHRHSHSHRINGELWLDGREITELAPEQREIGVVFQEPIVFPALSLVENAAFGLKVRGVPRAQRHEIVLPWLRRVGLGERLDVEPDQLSGGEKQRLSLVRAVVWKPKALLLDEPFSALDPGLRQELGEIVIELHQSLTVPLVLVTHDPQEASRLGTRELDCQILDGPAGSHHRIHEWVVQ